MLEYEVIRSLTSSQGAALFYSLSDLIRPWESLDRMYEEGSVAGWSTRKRWRGLEVLVVPKDTLEN